MNQELVFFLGGYDLEMVAIRDLLAENTTEYYDKNLAWGAVASAYSAEIARAISSHKIVVLIELRLDLPLPTDRIRIVDHHGVLASRDRTTSLEQIFELLEIEESRWSRYFSLVAANDRGYVEEMLEIGATSEEIAWIRSADRLAQGINAELERSAETAIMGARRAAEGRLTIVILPHDKTATVTDRLHFALGGPGFDNLLVICPNQVNFFGEGVLVLLLHSSFPGGWYGGAMPDRGFWGHIETGGDLRIAIENMLVHWLLIASHLT